ncbi:MAG: cell division protein ZapA [Mariprofundaceae bacterium]|nr:cell division protein ZapA [Mariprofundaceae bacterium]
MGKKIEVTLAGRTFSIKTEDSPGKVQSAADLVQQKLDQVRGLGSTAGSDRLMALVALNLAGELLTHNGHVNLDVEKTQSKVLISALNDVVSQAEILRGVQTLN